MRNRASCQPVRHSPGHIRPSAISFYMLETAGRPPRLRKIGASVTVPTRRGDRSDAPEAGPASRKRVVPVECERLTTIEGQPTRPEAGGRHDPTDARRRGRPRMAIGAVPAGHASPANHRWSPLALQMEQRRERRTLPPCQPPRPRRHFPPSCLRRRTRRIFGSAAAVTTSLRSLITSPKDPPREPSPGFRTAPPR